MISECDDPSFVKRLKRAEKFLSDLATGDRVYHHHKENMAYVSTALFITGCIGALVSDKWMPPKTTSPFFGVILPGLTLITVFAFFLIHLHWQLFNRGLIAMRLSAAQNVLAAWSCRIATPSDLKLVPENKQRDRHYILLERIWPSYSMGRIEDAMMRESPEVFVKAFKSMAEDRKNYGNPAKTHERTLYKISWTFFLILLARIIFSRLI